MESVFIAEGRFIREIPPNNGGYMFAAEPELEEAFGQFCLKLFIMRIVAKGRNRNFGNMDWKIEISVTFQCINKAKWISYMA